jgi:hypothetical protein
MSNLKQGKSIEKNYEYSGEPYQYCAECGGPINENDLTIITPLTYIDFEFTEVTHKGCYVEDDSEIEREGKALADGGLI